MRVEIKWLWLCAASISYLVNGEPLPPSGSYNMDASDPPPISEPTGSSHNDVHGSTDGSLSAPLPQGSYDGGEQGQDSSYSRDGSEANDSWTPSPTPSARPPSYAPSYGPTDSPGDDYYYPSAAPTLPLDGVYQMRGPERRLNYTFPYGWHWGKPFLPNGTILEFEMGEDGEHAVRRPRSFHFHADKGLQMNTEVEDCSDVKMCVHIRFHSDYGVSSDFDAFVLDRLETNMELHPKSFDVESGLPIVSGRMPKSVHIEDDMRHRFPHLKELQTERTVWTFVPRNGTRDLDLTMSFKQLATYLDGYRYPNKSNGPFYSENLHEQLVLRASTHLASRFAAASTVRPIIVNATGSQLIDLDFQSSILSRGRASEGGNEIMLDIHIKRRRYGIGMPWEPVEVSKECRACDVEKESVSKAMECIGNLMGMTDEYRTLNLISNGTEPLRLTPGMIHRCARNVSEFFSQPPDNNDERNSHDGSVSSGSGDHENDYPTTEMPSHPPRKPISPMEVKREVDRLLRCYIDRQCPSSKIVLKGRMAKAFHERPTVYMHFEVPEYAFSFELMVNNVSFPSPHFTHDQSQEDIATMIRHAIDSYTDIADLGVQVRKYNNLELIAEIEEKNEQLQRQMEGMHDGVQSGDNSGSESSLAQDDGVTASPSIPAMIPVPSPKYTIEVVFLNTTVGVNVTSVQSPIAMNWFFHPMKLGVASVPLDLDNFQYIPPSDDVDLSWHEDRDHGGSNDGEGFKLDGGACAKCTNEFLMCLAMDSCAFGVREYVWDAFQPHRLDQLNKTLRNEDTVERDISSVIRQARPFFPSDGFNHFGRFLTCLADQGFECNVDHEHGENNSNEGDQYHSRPTSLHYEPAYMEIWAPVNANFTSLESDFTYDLKMHHEPYQLAQWLQYFVFRNRSGVQVHVDQAQYGEIWEFKVKLHQFLGEAPKLVSRYPGFKMDYKPWRLALRRQMTYPGEWPPVRSTRLLGWLAMFHLMNPPVDWNNNGTDGNHHDSTSAPPHYGSSPPPYYETSAPPHYETSQPPYYATSQPPHYENGTNPPPYDYPTSNLTNGSVPLPSTSAICSPCADKLRACLSDPLCYSGAVQSFLPSMKVDTLLPEMHDGGNGKNRIDLSHLVPEWEAKFGAGYEKFSALLFCLSDKWCSVGYDHTDDPLSPLIPTHIQFSHGKTVLYVEHGSSIEFEYNATMNLFTESGNSSMLEQFLYHHVFKQAVPVRVVAHHNQTSSLAEYTIQYLKRLPLPLNILLNPPSTSQTAPPSASLLAEMPASPYWKNLLSWFTSGTNSSTPSTDAPIASNGTFSSTCDACLQIFNLCLHDPFCAAAVRDRLVPSFAPAMLAHTSFPNGSRTVYQSRFTALLEAMWMDSTVFPTMAYWHPLADTFLCLNTTRCDVEYPTNAVEPPATAHIPSYVAIRPGYMSLSLNMDTQIEFSYDNQLFPYTEMGDELALINLIKSQMLASQPGVRVSWFKHIIPNTNQISYHIEWQNYFGAMPQVMVMSNGVEGASPPLVMSMSADASFESIDSPPTWERLMDWFALTHTQDSTTPMPTTTDPTLATTQEPTMDPTMDPNTTTTPPSIPVMECTQCTEALRACYDDASCANALQNGLFNVLNNPPPMVPEDGQYVVDLTMMLETNVLTLTASTLQQQAIMNILACVAREACMGMVPVDPVTYPSPTMVHLNPSEATFSAPIGASIDVLYDVNTFSFEITEDVGAFEMFLETSVLGGMGIDVVAAGQVVDGMMNYHIQYNGLYSGIVPHLNYMGSLSNLEPQTSVTTPWRFYFASPDNPTWVPLTQWLSVRP